MVVFGPFRGALLPTWSEPGPLAALSASPFKFLDSYTREYAIDLVRNKKVYGGSWKHIDVEPLVRKALEH